MFLEGAILDEKLHNLHCIVEKLRETCSRDVYSRSSAVTPRMLCADRVLDAIVDTAMSSCSEGWIRKSVLTRARTHEVARQQDLSAIAEAFTSILNPPPRFERIPKHGEDALNSLYNTLKTLYGPQADYGK